MNPIFPLRFELIREERSFEVLVLFVSSAELDESAFADIVEKEVEAALRPDIVLTVVRGPGFDASRTILTGSSAARAARDRIEPGASFELSGYDASGLEVRRESLGGTEPPVHIGYSDFRRRGVTDIFVRRGGFVESTPAFHFENPSGRHTEKFMRLSNILTRGAEVAFIAFASLPFIPADATVAYVDTPAVYAVVSAANEQLATFGRKPLLTDSFGSYQGAAAYPFARQGEAVVFISASSSSSLARMLSAKKGFDAQRILHILYLGRTSAPDRLVCDLRADPEKNPDGIDRLPSVEEKDGCSLCARGSMPIKLHGDQFDISGPQPEPLLITREDAPKKFRDQMGRLGGTRVLGIVPGADGRHEHRLFDISEAALLASETFTRRLGYVFRRGLSGALTHVVQVGIRSSALAAHVCDVAAGSGVRPTLCREDALDGILPGSCGSIAVVAAAIESGRGLLDVSRDLRSLAKGVPILYVVAVEKTTALEARERLRGTLAATDGAFENLFVAVETIKLPASQPRNAWRSELDLLRSPEVDAIIPAALRDFFDLRIAALRKGDAPILDGIFLPNRPGVKLEVQPGFVFWPPQLAMPGAHTEADVFFTVSSILQHLRASAQKPGHAALRSTPFQQTLLAAENFGRFNDDAIQAALLRSATPRELNYAAHPDASAQAARLMRRILASADLPRGGAAAEFLMAIACGRLSLMPADREAVLEITPNPVTSPVAAFLADLCRSRPT